MAFFMVRAGKYGEQEHIALENDVVITGWDDLGDLSGCDRDAIKARLREVYSSESEHTITNWASQLNAFLNKIQIGDYAIIPLKTRPHIAIGKVKSDYRFEEVDGVTSHVRKIAWKKTDIPRSAIGQDLLYSLGAFSTVCEIKRNDAESRLLAILDGKKDPEFKDASDPVDNGESDDTSVNLEDIAKDQIRARIQSRFKGHEMERLVEHILIAEGFTTFRVPPGPDGGVDILAGKGEFGFDQPRMCVQVKSSNSPVDVTVLRNLQGILNNFDAQVGLLVAWGGFNTAVQKEAQKSFFSIRLWSDKELIEALQRNFDQLSEDLQAEIPIKQMWVLADPEV